MAIIKLSLAFFQEKQKIKIKRFITPTIIFLSSFLIWLFLSIAGLPRPGKIILFFILVLVPFIIIASLIKLDVDRLKKKAKLLNNGLYISEMSLAEKESYRDVHDNVIYSFKLISKDKDENIYSFTHHVSYREYINSPISYKYYVIHLQHKDELGERYVLEGVYPFGKYILSDELKAYLVDYSEIEKANEQYANSFWDNKK
jgi:hypothetical protein